MIDRMTAALSVTMDFVSDVHDEAVAAADARTQRSSIRALGRLQAAYDALHALTNAERDYVQFVIDGGREALVAGRLVVDDVPNT